MGVLECGLIFYVCENFRVQDMVVFKLFSLVVSVGLLLLLAACSDGKPETVAPPLTGSAALFAHGKQKSRMCTACHGPAGISRVVSYPSLAGKPEDYLAEQLQAFRSGTRENPMMSSIAKNLSDDDVAALAHYYAGLPGAEVEKAQR